jgi:hypothetical protein
MKIKIALVTLIGSMSINLMAQTDLIANANSLNNDELWSVLTTFDVNGNTAFGKCKVQDARQCASCACDYYFTANIVGSVGKYGWPKNPASGDSTGCMNGCWGGYTPNMCTSDIKANARAMLLRSLNDNACGTPLPPTPNFSLHVSEVTKYKFVNPQLNGGEIRCGTAGLTQPIAGVPQFKELNDKTCRSSYMFALKAEANGGPEVSYVTLVEFNLLIAATTNLQNQIVQAGQANIAYDVLSLTGIQPLIDSPAPALLPKDQIALLYATLGSNISKLPSATRASLDPIEASLTQAEKNVASAELATKQSKVVESKNYTSLESAIVAIKAQPGINAQPGL